MSNTTKRNVSPCLRSCLRSIALAALALAFAAPPTALASGDLDDDASILEMKEKWQSRYRKLLSDAALLRRNANAARDNYSQAKQRNYPRGLARKQFLIDAEAAEAELVAVEAEIEQVRDDGRREGVLPGWFYEVEDGPLDVPRPAAPAEDEPVDREGRNPLYFESE